MPRAPTSSFVTWLALLLLPSLAWVAPSLALVAPSLALARSAPEKTQKQAWLGDEMPLQLSVKTADDLAFKSAAERQYLIFNLMAGGKLAWDAGDYAGAARRWESLLRLPDLPPELAKVVAPFAIQARSRAGGSAASAVALPPAQAKAPPRPHAEHAAPARPSSVTVKGLVSGGGARGPGGTVVWLERADGPTPRPKAAKGKVVYQRNKSFVPRVLAVPVGTTVAFENDDSIFHDVFSLNRPNDFDLGLYKGGEARSRAFESAGPVHLLCNIHTSMQAWIYAVPSPYFTQADASGAFTIRAVPPGRYVLHAWHEAASRTTEQPLEVGDDGAQVTLAVGADARAPTFVPDKYGKPRQAQLGY